MGGGRLKRKQARGIRKSKRVKINPDPGGDGAGWHQPSGPWLPCPGEQEVSDEVRPSPCTPI